MQVRIVMKRRGRPAFSEDTPRRRRPRRYAEMQAAAAALALALAACGGGSTGGGAPEPADSAPVQAPETPASEVEASEVEGTPAETGGRDEAGEPEDDGDGEQPETLAEYLGFDLDDPDATAAQAKEMERRMQESTARCMAQEGFEYIPAVDPGSSAFTISGTAFDQEEYVREQGFGITTWYGREETGQASGAAWVDPNKAIVEAMSESESSAYYEALYGYQTESSEGADQSGCQGKAFQEVYGQMERMFEELGPMLDEMYQRFLADPRYQEATGEWSGCMSDRGYVYDDVEQMYDTVYTDFGRRLDELVGSSDPFDGWTQEQTEAFYEENSDEEIEDFFQQARIDAREAVDQEALAALQQEEIDLAVANFKCSESFQETVAELQQEYESEFIGKNRGLLDELREA